MLRPSLPAEREQRLARAGAAAWPGFGGPLTFRRRRCRYRTNRTLVPIEPPHHGPPPPRIASQRRNHCSRLSSIAFCNNICHERTFNWHLDLRAATAATIISHSGKASGGAT